MFSLDFRSHKKSKMPEKRQKLKRKPPKPASEKLGSITEDQKEEEEEEEAEDEDEEKDEEDEEEEEEEELLATQYIPHSIRIPESEGSSFVPDLTSTLAEEDLSVDDSTLTPAPQSSKFDMLWTSAAPLQDDTLANPRKSHSSAPEQPSDLETGVVREKNDSEPHSCKGKEVWAAVIMSLLMLVVIVTTIVVVTNNNNTESTESPTESPTSAPTVFMCTVCSGGSAPDNPGLSPEGWVGFTCDDLGTVMSGLDTTVCKEFQDAIAEECGCNI
jgi:hypothetical protein